MHVKKNCANCKFCLQIKGSPKVECTGVLHLKNDGENKVLFKVKLKMEENLHIEPSRGIIEPKSSMEVNSKYQTIRN